MLARESRVLPADDGWAFEIKWDGVRAFAVSDGAGGASLQSRRGEDLSARYPELAIPPGPLASRAVVLDGEIVALDAGGKPSFQLLQQRMGVTSPLTIARRVETVPVTFIAFDLLALDGDDVAELPYERRRELLAELEVEAERWRSPRHHLGDGAALLEAAARQRLEGVVAKRLDSPYRPGTRSRDWLKVRLRKRQDFVIGGWMGGQGGRSGRLGSLLVGVWDATPGEAAARDEPQRLVHAGGVGSGLSGRSIAQLEELLGPLARETSPFELGVGPKRAVGGWVEPRLVCAVEFSEWTREGTLRQPAFKGLRDDVPVEAVVREPD